MSHAMLQRLEDEFFSRGFPINNNMIKVAGNPVYNEFLDSQLDYRGCVLDNSHFGKMMDGSSEEKDFYQSTYPKLREALTTYSECHEVPDWVIWTFPHSLTGFREQLCISRNNFGIYGYKRQNRTLSLGKVSAVEVVFAILMSMTSWDSIPIGLGSADLVKGQGEKLGDRVGSFYLKMFHHLLMRPALELSDLNINEVKPERHFSSAGYTDAFIVNFISNLVQSETMRRILCAVIANPIFFDGTHYFSRSQVDWINRIMDNSIKAGILTSSDWNFSVNDFKE